MPHSSGGGHHGGGHHSSSHSHHSGSGSGNYVSRRTSRSAFRGASRYVYYRRHRPYYVYADYDITRQESQKGRKFLLIIYIPFFIAIFFGMILGSFGKPSKIKTNYDTSIVIEDNLGVIQDEDALYRSLASFYNETGISPAVVTMENSDWKPHYSSLEKCAYSKYLNMFHDEKHWLIVYSHDILDDGFVDWYFEGMQGDDTDPIITTKLADDFTSTMYARLSDTTHYPTVDSAIAATFDYITPKAMESHVNGETLGMGILFMFFICIHCYFMVFFGAPKKEYKKAVKITESAREIKCNYCDGIYVEGTVSNCPHCGAAIAGSNFYGDADQQEYYN